MKHLVKMILLMCQCVSVIYPAVPGQAASFKIASYNVENLFDLNRDLTEYDDYAPYGPSGWNRAVMDVKFDNITRVLKDLDADIVSLQEIESGKALALLQHRLHLAGAGYVYSAIADDRPTAVKCAVLSRYPIILREEVGVGQGRDRNILKVTVDIGGTPLILYVNHWKSKMGPESRRIPCARALAEDIEGLKSGVDFVLTGDFNSDYNEYETFKNIGRLNDTHGITGINHILKTVVDGRIVDESVLTTRQKDRYLYNLWMELPEERRWSVIFSGLKNTLDSILVSASLYDDSGVNYLDNSFKPFAPDYLFKEGRIYRWQRGDRGRGRHLGKGFSDHLPVFAEFTTQPFRFETGREIPMPMEKPGMTVH
ncbi:MAG: endonuclease/exonuclease/phosphatase family protein [Desulfosalsimonadaceae bacterium]